MMKYIRVLMMVVFPFFPILLTLFPLFLMTIKEAMQSVNA